MSVVIDGTKYSLFEDLDLSGESLLLHSLSSDDEFSKVFHLIRPNEAKKEFKLGRSHTADVKLRNNIASRLHALIVFNEKEYLLTDLNSRYGTLVLLRGKQELFKDRNLSVQVKSSLITLGIKERITQKTNSESNIDRQNVK